MTGGGSPEHSVDELDGAYYLDGVLGGDQELRPGFDGVAVLSWIRCDANIGSHRLSLYKNLSHLKRRRPETRIIKPFGGVSYANERVRLAKGPQLLTRVD